ncbi:Thioesterase superfamily protein [Sulfobacillus thermosulfidooxidans DSM 9293]|uniref:Thioesterase superfamily protein n=1 Tax=Sulfobacillus thermosulfidooxidans (strain DSM 9293 / VKM B-1269 / AT-1) TaxID=929705 RepID=A0A1W1WDQ3_SULTA|nr:PaaI family thioesterase [Sulfobacillus thermosulfidooxidans]SMC03853.1 Thioesterase superfamily protein [Sulfobacillus thermosulfidooxidans DSM 9293]
MEDTNNQKSFFAVQDFYPDDFAWCYGCGRLNDHGHHFRTRWNNEETLTEYIPLPQHIAVPGFVYGGLLASLVDCHSTGSAALALYRQDGHELGDAAPVPRCVTASLKIDFVKPTPLGQRLTVRGRIVEIGRRKVIVHSDVYAGDTLCAKSEVVAVLAPTTMRPPI